jgi:hypothetical protein
METGCVFGEVALFPDMAPPFRAESAVANSWVIVYTLSVRDMPAIEAMYPLVVGKLRELCQLRVAHSRANGHSYRAFEEVDIFGRGAVQQCTLNLKTVIAQVQRDLLIIKEQRVLLPLSSMEDGKVLKLLITSCDSSDSQKVGLISISCVVSARGELLCIEQTTAGIASDGLRSLGFFVTGRSAHRMMGVDEVRRLAGIGELQLFGCCVVVHDQPGAAVSPEMDCGGGGNSSKPASFGEREIHLFSWLDEELEGLEESLDALQSSYGPLYRAPLQQVLDSDDPAAQWAVPTTCGPCVELF